VNIYIVELSVYCSCSNTWPIYKPQSHLLYYTVVIAALSDGLKQERFQLRFGCVPAVNQRQWWFTVILAGIEKKIKSSLFYRIPHIFSKADYWSCTEISHIKNHMEMNYELSKSSNTFSSNLKASSWVWWPIPVIPPFWRKRQGSLRRGQSGLHSKFQVCLCCVVRLCFKKKKSQCTPSTTI
jgi:hypothetical protein